MCRQTDTSYLNNSCNLDNSNEVFQVLNFGKQIK